MSKQACPFSADCCDDVRSCSSTHPSSPKRRACRNCPIPRPRSSRKCPCQRLLVFVFCFSTGSDGASAYHPRCGFGAGCDAYISEQVWRLYAQSAKMLLATHGRCLCTSIFENAALLDELLGARRTLALHRSIISVVARLVSPCALLFNSARGGRRFLPGLQRRPGGNVTPDGCHIRRCARCASVRRFQTSSTSIPCMSTTPPKLSLSRIQRSTLTFRFLSQRNIIIAASVSMIQQAASRQAQAARFVLSLLLIIMHQSESSEYQYYAPSTTSHVLPLRKSE